MKKISFKELHDLVANIDYIDEESFPIKFSSIIRGEKRKFECGITKSFMVEGDLFDEHQYFITEVNVGEMKFTSTLDLQDADNMSYDGIEKMLNKFQINENSEIFLYETSFSGKRKNVRVPNWFEAKVIETHTQHELTDEVKKGLDYFREILQEEIVLVSAKKGEYENLNGMSGSTFSFMFDRKVLYYDKLNCAICTYCPYSSKSDRKFLLKRIEANDGIRWILLYICNREDFLSRFKPCYIVVEDMIDGSKRVINNINAKQIDNARKELYDKITKDLEVLGQDAPNKENFDAAYELVSSTLSKK